MVSNEMTFKQFMDWCNDRACDGAWGYNHAITSIKVIDDVRKQFFLKREKYWRENYRDWVYEEIVKPVSH